MSHTHKTSLFFIVILIAALAGAGGFLAARHLSPPQGASSVAASKDAHGHEEGEPHGEKHPPAPPAMAAHAEAGHEEDAHAEAEHGPGAEGGGETDPHGHGGHDGHAHAAEISDLDRSVDEMWAARCEHDILHYQCDECRYELGTVKLDASLLGDNGLVRTGFPETRQSSREDRSLPGEVQLDETRTVHVASPLTGLITRGFTTPGVMVEAGAPLFEVDSPEVAEAKSGYLKARAALDLARKGAEREALLFSKKIAAEVEVQEAVARRAEAETDLAAARGRLLRLGLGKAEIEGVAARKEATALTGLVVIRASRAGTVIEGHAAPGEMAEAGKELLTIADLSTVWVLADVKESDLAVVTGAMGGESEIDVLNQRFPARLETVAGRMSEATRTAKARFSVKNGDNLLRPGMFVSVRLFLPSGGESLAVPKVAVLADEGRTFVFTHKEGDYWVRRPVTLGRKSGSMVEIVSGLAAGQRIITDGSFLLKSDVLRGKMGAGCAD